MKIRCTYKSMIVCVVFSIMLVASLFQIPTLQIIDEMVCISFLIYIFLKCCTKKILQQNIISNILKYIIMLSVIGLISNFMFQKQYGWLYVLEDMFLFFKPFIIFLGTYLLMSRQTDIRYTYSYLQYFAKLISIILMIGLLYNQISSDTVMGTYSIWGPIPSLKIYIFFAKYPAFLSVCVGILLIILSSESSKKNNVYIVFNCIILIFTQSGTGWLMVCIFVILNYIRYKKKMRWYHIVGLLIFGSIAGWNEIKEYILNPTAARSIMYYYSFITAQKFFPLGSGFSTYGGTIAGKVYAKLYYEYGFMNYWGLSQDRDVNFLYDSFYPMVIGEFGFIGTLVYIDTFYFLFKRVNNILNTSIRYSLLYGLATIILMGIGQGTITSMVGAMYMFLLALLYRKAELSKELL